MTSERRPFSNRAWLSCKHHPSADSHTSRNAHENTKSKGNANDVIRVLTYNILAQAYLQYGPFRSVPHAFRKLTHRVNSLASELQSYDADILCLQENDMHETHLWPRFAPHAYRFVHSKRPYPKPDGCSIYFRASRFHLLQSASIRCDSLCFHVANRASKGKYRCSNIGVVALLQDLQHAEHASEDHPPSSALQLPLVLVVNVHLFWNPAYPEVKLLQCLWIAQRVREMAIDAHARYGRMPAVVYCGDFNSLPDSSVYRVLHGEAHWESLPEWPLLCDDFGGADAFRAFADAYLFDPSRSATDGFQSAYRNYRFLRQAQPLLTEETRRNTPHHMFINHLSPARAADAGHGEPEYTNFTSEFVGTLDYVWSDRSLTVQRVLEVLPEAYLALQQTLPNDVFCSDHIALVAELAYRNSL